MVRYWWILRHQFVTENALHFPFNHVGLFGLWVHNACNKPIQKHHIATNKSKKYTSKFEKIAQKYGLDLDQEWNKISLPHQGRHPNKYHEYVLKFMRNIDKVAQGDQGMFLKLYKQIEQIISDNPDMLCKSFWK